MSEAISSLKRRRAKAARRIDGGKAMTTVTAAPVIEATGLVKTYGATRALDGLDLAVPKGTVLGLLGPNGAGKTTAVRILTTLLEPDAGSARVAGHDVVREAAQVRANIGLSGQYAAVDEYLTGFENLDMVGRLYGLGARRSRERARELLDRFRLDEAADRPVKTYSGGMRRRLDLAGALVAQPPVLFLDEPTTGLDPRSRTDMWDVIVELVSAGSTLLLTTQYLDEADRLADDILVIDHGKAIAQGTADELKAQVGGERVEVVLANPADLDLGRSLLADLADGAVSVEPHTRRLTAPVTGGAASLIEALRRFDSQHIALLDVALRRPTLDDVFLTLTGHAAEIEAAEMEAAEPKKEPVR
jgi:ABC-2 type transport system ATP-binding protein